MINFSRFVLGGVLYALWSALAMAACPVGAYGNGSGAFVVLGVPANTANGQRYLFLDGRRGSTGDVDTPVRCVESAVGVKVDGNAEQVWQRVETREATTSFNSVFTQLAGKLIEPPMTMSSNTPLVVMVHGSERTPALDSVYAYMLAAQGISVFVYDKRGTGRSQGEYTQNFELLADDAAAAFTEAKRLAAGRYGRAGYFGGSQGGWVAPLAATRTKADFVAIGFGLVVSPIDEDREQMLQEAKEMGLDGKATRQIEALSRATATLVRSHFTRGFEQLARVRQEMRNEPWVARIQGEYSGDMLRMSDADLRRVGRARFDNLELIWDYNAAAVLRKLRVPLLWVLAGEDREAPIATTRAALGKLAAEGRPVDVYLFPDTDHGMVEFTTAADGSRKATRITDGYLRLLADWIKGDARGSYGRGERLRFEARKAPLQRK